MAWKKFCVLSAVLLCTSALMADTEFSANSMANANAVNAPAQDTPELAPMGIAPIQVKQVEDVEPLPVSYGLAPLNPAGGPSAIPLVRPMTRAPTDTGWGVNNAAEQVVDWTLNNPGTLNAHGLASTGFFLGAGAFGNEQTYAFMYVADVNNDLYTMSTVDGSMTFIGSGTLQGGQTYSGMAYNELNQQMYANATDITASGLYIIDLSNGAATYIGDMGSPGAIALAVDCLGNLYSYDIVNDDFGSVNPATGAYTVIGPLGFDANFGQGMEFDDDDGTLYMSAFNSGSFQAELRIVNTGDGSSVLVGALGIAGTDQVGFMDVNQNCGPYIPKFGACCDDMTGICQDGIEQLQCPLGNRFAESVLCADLQPPCGSIPGACCLDGVCEATLTESDCYAQYPGAT